MPPLITRALFVLTLLLVAPSASADVHIRQSPGGEVIPFLKLFAALRASGERVVIDGPCLSACTLLLSTLPRRQVCVTPNAVFGFHAAWSQDDFGRQTDEPEATAHVLKAYPPAIRRWIMQHGGLTSHMIMLRGPELAAMYPVCR